VLSVNLGRVLPAEDVRCCLVGKGRLKKRPIAVGGLSLALLLGTIYWGLAPQYVLSIENATRGKAIMETATMPGDNFWVVFINSVENLPVADHFIVNDHHQIQFTETIYQAPYAGYVFPDKGGRQELIAPGTIRISGYEKQMDKVTFFAGYTFQHMLLLNGHWLPIYEVVQGGDLIQITVTRRPRWAALFK